MIHCVKLRNWKSHESTEVCFGKGTNLIIGSMGSGKTSLIDAVCFALYGTFPSLKSRRVKLDDLIMRRPIRHSKAEVSLEFDSNGKSFVVSRSVSQGASEAFLREKNGTLLEGPQSQRVTEAVEGLLKVDYELFARSIYSEQNRIDYFVSLGRGERKKQVDELLGISRFEDARSSSAAVINRLNSLKEELDSRVNKNELEKARAELTALATETKELEERRANIASQLRDLEAQSKESALALTALEAREKQFNSLQREKASADALAKNFASQRDYRKALLSRSVSREELLEKPTVEAKAAELRKGLQQLREAQGEARALSLQAGSSAKEAATLGEVISASLQKQEVQRLQTELASLRKQASELDAEVAQANASADALAKQCRECEEKAARFSQVETEIASFEGAEAAAERLRVESAALRDLTASLDASAKQLESALHSLSTDAAACPVCDSILPPEKKTGLHSEKRALLEKTLSESNAARLKLQESCAEEKKQAEKASARLRLMQEKELLQKTVEKAGETKNSLSNAVALAGEKTGKRGSLLVVLKKSEESLEAARLLLEKAVEKERLFASAAQAQSNSSAARDKADALLKQFSENALEQAEKRLAELESAREVFAAEDALFQSTAKAVAVETELQKLLFSPAELADCRAKALQCNSAFSRASAENEGLSKLVEEKKKLASSRRELLSSAAAVEKEALLAAKRLSEMTVFQEALVETQSLLRTELVEAVNEAMASLWPSVYPYADYSCARLNASEDDYSLELSSLDGEWTSVEGVSGGERSCAALAMRVAFAMVLTPELSWLVLDEPTHNLDRQAVALLCRALHEQIPKIVEQTFIITHDEALKEGASAKVFFVERDKERGDKSSVQEMCEMSADISTPSFRRNEMNAS